MTIPLIVLAILSTVGGLIGVPYAISSLAGGHPENYFEEVLAPVVGSAPTTATVEGTAPKIHWESPQPQETDGKPAVAPVVEAPGTATAHETPTPQELNEERLLAFVSVLIALSGIGIGWFMFLRHPERAMPRLLENKYYVDEIYDATIIQPIEVGSREGLWKIVDVGAIDGILVHGPGEIVKRLAQTLRYMQFGFVRGYAAIILAGALIIIGYFAYSGAHVLRFLVR
jgi:NADH-quinone oxidoreductase subunit L